MVSDAGVEAVRTLLPDPFVRDAAAARPMVAGDRNDAFNDGVMPFRARFWPGSGPAFPPGNAPPGTFRNVPD